MENALNFTLKMCEKYKPETRVSERHKPGFRVWQNERVSRVPGFPKPRFPSLVASSSGVASYIWRRIWLDGHGVRVHEIKQKSQKFVLQYTLFS